MLQGLHHVAYRCRDAGETAEFYTKLLDLKLAHVIVQDRVPSTQAFSPHAHVPHCDDVRRHDCVDRRNARRSHGIDDCPRGRGDGYGGNNAGLGPRRGVFPQPPPGPSPFLAMNSTPANSRVVRMAAARGRVRLIL